MPFFFWAPLLFLVVRLLWTLASTAPFDVSGGGVVLALGLPFLLSFLFQTVAAYVQPVSQAEALASLDEGLGLRDRLTSAVEFLRSPARSAFEQAALEDARLEAARALDRPLPAIPEARPVSQRAFLAPLCGIVIAAVALTMPARPAEKIEVATSPGSLVAKADAKKKDDRQVAAPKPAPAVEAPRERPQASTPPQKTTASKDAAEREQPKEEKRSEGMTKPGETASAGAPSGSAAAKGTPTQQGQPSKQTPPGKRLDKKPKEQKPKEEAAAEKKEMKESSGSTMSRGAAGGATKNPVSSDWSTRDEVQLPEDEQLKDDENVEDEESKDQARGGLQPNLRDRRPPPNRDLSISFGSRPGGDGRGGPSAQKKQRGTAALVFGVPVPDHVRGRLNPGTTKVTQERVEPRPEQAPAVAAAARTPRSGSAGFVPENALSAALRRLLKTYSLKQRSTTEQEEKRP